MYGNEDESEEEEVVQDISAGIEAYEQHKESLDAPEKSASAGAEEKGGQAL
jgi:putative mRNA 3-end processing factor